MPLIQPLARRTIARFRRTPGLGAAAALIVTGFIWETLTLFVPSSPIRAAGRQLMVVDEFPSGISVGQTFRASADAIDWVRLQFSSDQPAEVQLRCWLSTASNNAVAPWAEIVNWTTSVRLPAGRSWHQFDFPPVLRSEKKIYEFRIRILAARSDGTGAAQPLVALVGSRDSSLVEGNLVAGSDPRLSQDLLFQAGFSDDLFSDLRRDIITHLPRWLRNSIVQLVILGVYNLAFVIFVGALLLEREDRSTG